MMTPIQRWTLGRLALLAAIGLPMAAAWHSVTASRAPEGPASAVMASLEQRVTASEDRTADAPVVATGTTSPTR